VAVDESGGQHGDCPVPNAGRVFEHPSGFVRFDSGGSGSASAKAETRGTPSILETFIGPAGSDDGDEESIWEVS